MFFGPISFQTIDEFIRTHILQTTQVTYNIGVSKDDNLKLIKYSLRYNGDVNCFIISLTREPNDIRMVWEIEGPLDPDRTLLLLSELRDKMNLQKQGLMNIWI